MITVSLSTGSWLFSIGTVFAVETVHVFITSDKEPVVGGRKKSILYYYVKGLLYIIK
jgi:hypothetical protein